MLDSRVSVSERYPREQSSNLGYLVDCRGCGAPPGLAFIAAITIEVLIDVLLEADAPSALLAFIAAA